MIDRIKQFIDRAIKKNNRSITDPLDVHASDLKKQLQRIEDRISRIESGMEAGDFLSKASRLKVRNLDLSTLSLDETFDYIYEHRLWAEGTSMLSGPGSYGPWADRFVKLIHDFIKQNSIKTILDIGCGDFNIGSQLCPLAKKYHALDISHKIISINKERFKHIPNVEFQQANACIDPLPLADLVIVRQVLQHLTNTQIESILRNIQKTQIPFAIIVEHLPYAKNLVRPNIDLTSQSDLTRLQLGSGVYINEPPFSLPTQQIDEYEGFNGLLAVLVWKPQSGQLLEQP